MYGEHDSHVFYATHPGILTSAHSTSPYDLASLRAERSPTTPIQRIEVRGFGARLKPRISSAQDHSTSELLRTL